VVVFSIKLNINQKAQTIEEILSHRKQTAITFADNVSKEFIFDVKLISNSDSSSSRAGLNELLAFMKQQDPVWFNSDVNLKNILGRVLEAKEEAVSAFVKAEQSLIGNPDKVLVSFFSHCICLARMRFAHSLYSSGTLLELHHVLSVPCRFAKPNCWTLQVVARRR
jgi:hypothetical protein